MAVWVGTPKSYTPGRNRPVQYVVIHATDNTEGATSAEAGASYDKRRTDGTSTHILVDSDSAVREVQDADRAHHARYHGNEIGLGVEICGYASQTAAQWDDDVSRATLQIAAREVAQMCRDHGLPPIRLSVAEVRAAYYAPAGQRPKGICGHVDVTKAYPEDNGTHTDPGSGFPWDRFLALVATEMGDDMQQAEKLTYPTDYADRTVGNVLADLSNMWQWLYSAPGTASKNPNPPSSGSRAAKLVDGVAQLVSAAAADATRDAATLAAVQALANAGGVDGAPIVAAIREEADKTRAAVAELQLQLAAAEAENHDLRTRLSAAIVALVAVFAK